MIETVDATQLLLDFCLGKARILASLGEPEIDLVAHEDYEGSRHCPMYFFIPLHFIIITLLIALTKVDFSATEKVIRKISVLG